MSTNFAFVIEDDLEIADIFACALDALGFTTEIVASGSHAVDYLSQIAGTAQHLPEVNAEANAPLIWQNELAAGATVIVATTDPHMAYLVQDMADVVVLNSFTYFLRGRDMLHV